MAEATAAPFVAAPLLNAIFAGDELSAENASALMHAIIDGRVTPASLAALAVALRMKGETAGELAALAGTMRARAIKISAPAGALDTCGTGGDGSNTFNISTAVALAAAGIGIPVAKHGGRAASSSSGSADVLKELGVNIDVPPATVERAIREAGIGFLFAQVFHPGMKHAAPVRRELGVRTFFNLLGPLSNPAGAKHQLLGVFAPTLCPLFAQVLQRLGSERALIVCGTGVDGRGHLDELSLYGPSVVARLLNGVVVEETFDPAEHGFAVPVAGALAAASPAESAQIIREVLAGKPGPRRDIVVLNTAAAAWAAGRAPDWRDGFELAKESLDSGAAAKALERLVKATNT